MRSSRTISITMKIQQKKEEIEADTVVLSALHPVLRTKFERRENSSPLKKKYRNVRLHA